jgi:hypothetical protein
MAWNEIVNKDKATVVLCVPHFGNVSLEWVDSTYAPFRYIPQPDYNKGIKMARGILNLDTERNLLVKMALWNPEPNGDIIVGKNPTDATHVMFLDTDVIMEKPLDVNVAIRMMLDSMKQMNASIVSGVYRAKKKEGFPYAMWMKSPVGMGYVPISSWTGNFVKVDVIGFGFCLLKREVFEKTPYPWFTWFPDPTPSEDFVFCENAKKAGFGTFVHCGITLSHIGQLKVTCDSGNVVTLSV